MIALITYFSSSLRLLPSSCAPLWRRCRQIPHGTDGTRAQVLCLGPGLLIYYQRVNVLGRLQSWLLVPTCRSWLALLAGGLQGKIMGSPRYGCLLEIFGILHCKISARGYFLLHQFPDCYISDNMS